MQPCVPECVERGLQARPKNTPGPSFGIGSPVKIRGRAWMSGDSRGWYTLHVTPEFILSDSDIDIPDVDGTLDE